MLPKIRRPFERLVASCLVSALVACGTQEPILNSERIEKTFGSYGIDIIQADERGRVSSLYSGVPGNKVTRTFAVVEFNGPVRRAFANEHSLVRSGQSIGTVFKSAGWDMQKVNVFIGEMEVTEKYALLSDLMEIALPATLAMHVYELVIRKDDRTFDYATIVELHHPDYLSAADLEAIYGEIIFDDSDRHNVDDYIAPEIWAN